MLPSRILVATDGSPSAKAAEAFAAEMAVAEHASTVDIVTVALRHLVRGTVLPPSAAEVETAKQRVEEAAEHIRWMIGNDSIAIEKKVLEATVVAGAIIAEADASDTGSHIVMGNRGHGEMAGLLLGSISHKVIRRAHCPVTIIRV